MNKREFLSAGVGAGMGVGLGLGAARAASAQPLTADQQRIQRETRRAAQVPHRQVKSTLMFKSPEGYPNGMDVAPEGFWVAEQLTVEGIGSSSNVNLVDPNGKLLKTVRTESKNTSGLAYGGGYLWVGGNAEPNGIYQTDLNSRLVARRDIPLGGGGDHGAAYHEGKVYLTANRLRGILRVDAKTWAPEYLIPWTFPRTHDIAYDKGALWMVTGSGVGAGEIAGLAKYDAATGALLETAEFVPGSADPHGLACRDGVLYSCDAGVHPGWELHRSPASGYIFRIDFV
ncbi:MAG: hypothetical protein JWQ46_1018 [Phenylobacterium sp.]|nr:hypothetical protein [Phenylobacterium sp.]